ncbi:MAG: hypothetical protein K0U59_02745 [Gammaproteobacteria bacterium]|nr:hypothetical protein [Gammaproteobacteria bacterium]
MQFTETLAQGCYHYSCDGRTMPVQDTWQLGRDKKGRRLLTSQRLVGELGFGITARAVLSAKLVTECLLHWRDETGEVSARYQLLTPAGKNAHLNNPVDAHWCGPNGPQHRVLSEGARLLFPLMRIFMGPLLINLSQFKEGCEVVTPDIVDPSQRGKLLAPRVSHRQAQTVVGDATTLGAQDLGNEVSAFIYHGDEAERDAHCFVDKRGLLVGYDWPSSTGRLWKVRLRDLEWSSQLNTLA